jgi:hypothetical protein
MKPQKQPKKKPSNPFVYGGRVSGEAFWDRRSETDELLEDIRARQHVIIFSQRRLGKTSLVWKVLEEAAREDIIPVYVDLYPISTLAEFIEEYAKAIARALGPYEKAVKLMRELFSRIHLSMGVDAAGKPQWSVGFDRKMEAETFDEVISSLEGYLRRKKKFGAVVFDEFQQIVETDGEKTERRLRSAIQTHQRTCYFFVGSRKHLMQDLFSNPNRPFYRSGKIFPLGKIPFDDISEFIKKRFQEGGLEIGDTAVKAILETTECHPYYTQYLCHVLYDLQGGPAVHEEDISKALDLLLHRETPGYMNTWDLLTVRQKQTLMALSETAPGEMPFRHEMLRRFGMSQPAVMLRALSSLMEKDLVDKEDGKYEIVDLIFKKWIRTYISKSTRF